MKRSFFYPLILPSLILLGMLQAVEIPVKDLTQEEAPKIAPPIPKAIPVHPQTEASTLKTSVKLELALREIQLLRKAAQIAGGDLEIIIRPLGGIHAEDLIIPLTQSGDFVVKPGQTPGAIRVESKTPSEEKTPSKLQPEKSTYPTLSPKPDLIPTLILK